MDFVPGESAIKTDVIETDKETINILVALGMTDLSSIVNQAEPALPPPAFGTQG
uniref:Uncharacterized protein n=1 Tax=Nelumbo nucifera TaxID=4432 RepID=A0A822ZPC5_NELNU|nr:TPA_asm: hypothetical protein HUJ06_004550 [Nelumbo nucifera]